METIRALLVVLDEADEPTPTMPARSRRQTTRPAPRLKTDFARGSSVPLPRAPMSRRLGPQAGGGPRPHAPQG